MMIEKVTEATTKLANFSPTPITEEVSFFGGDMVFVPLYYLTYRYLQFIQIFIILL